MQTAQSERYFIWILLTIVAALTVAIFWPFLAVLALALAFAILLSPIYKWIKKRIFFNKVSWLASLLTVIIFFAVLCVPIFFVGKAVFNQIQNIYNNTLVAGHSETFLKTIDTSINKLMPVGFHFDTYGKIAQLTSTLSKGITNFFASTFKTVAMFILMLLSIFYLLKDGRTWKKGVISLFPISEKNANELYKTMKDSINRIFRGSFLVAIIQGILMSIGLAIFGVPNAVIWGVVASISSFVPTLGTSIVSVPAILFLYFTGMHWQALGMLIWAVVSVGSIDNLLTPYFISNKTDISSLFTLFSILGGVVLMGPVGIFIGPLILSMLFGIVSIYKKETSIST